MSVSREWVWRRCTTLCGCAVVDLRNTRKIQHPGELTENIGALASLEIRHVPEAESAYLMGLPALRKDGIGFRPLRPGNLCECIPLLSLVTIVSAVGQSLSVAPLCACNRRRTSVVVRRMMRWFVRCCLSASLSGSQRFLSPVSHLWGYFIFASPLHLWIRLLADAMGRYPASYRGRADWK
jgi:hypothetical protein